MVSQRPVAVRLSFFHGGLSDRLHLVCGFRSLGVAGHGDFPLSPAGFSHVNVSKQSFVLFYEAPTHATCCMRLLNRYQKPSYAYVSLQVIRRRYFIFISR